MYIFHPSFPTFSGWQRKMSLFIQLLFNFCVIWYLISFILFFVRSVRKKSNHPCYHFQCITNIISMLYRILRWFLEASFIQNFSYALIWAIFTSPFLVHFKLSTCFRPFCLWPCQKLLIILGSLDNTFRKEAFYSTLYA